MHTTPYGSWPSPITAELITKAAPGLNQPQSDGDNLYWLESRPWEEGRQVVMRRRPDGTIEDALPAPLGAHSKAHEYGGAPYLVVDNSLYFCLDRDQRIYRLRLDREGALPEPITADNPALRYADFCFDRARNRLIAVCERHIDGRHEPQNSLVAIALTGNATPVELVGGADFYANPRLSPDGTQLSWICWHHPQMPWDGTELWLADLGDELRNRQCVAGGARESIFQPQWSPAGELVFASDRSNWWNLYRLASDGSAIALCPMDAEFALPQWVFGMSTFGFLDAHTIACCYTQQGQWQLATLDMASGELTDIDTPYTDIATIFATAGRAWFIGGSASAAPELVEFHEGQVRAVYGGAELPFHRDYLSAPESVSFPTGAPGGDLTATAHGLLYRPTSPDHRAGADERPPLMVMCHGGPTAATGTGLNFKAQYWASRGFAVLDVNYRGSTGYGRDYRDALKGNWGIADVEDVVCGARYLAEQGIVDPERVAIRGGSAGGYTVLAALTFHDTFKAGASLYGIGDLELLATETHKFEARYMDTLVGPYPATKQTYIDRSPIHHIEQLASPVIFLQGLDDKVVPPSQAEVMVAALNSKQIPVAYVPLAGEGHGFRKAKNIVRAYEAELYFYAKVFGFELAEDVAPIHIQNLER